MTPQLIYKDSTFTLNESEIRIANYYFPMGQEKVIPLTNVRSIWAEKLTLWNGKYRIWGMGLRPYWLNCDPRMDKNYLIVVDTGAIIKAAFTPDQFDLAFENLRSKVDIEIKET